MEGGIPISYKNNSCKLKKEKTRHICQTIIDRKVGVLNFLLSRSEASIFQRLLIHSLFNVFIQGGDFLLLLLKIIIYILYIKRKILILRFKQVAKENKWEESHH